jgi:glycosyltransferase involved in cell wall biosynthesis
MRPPLVSILLPTYKRLRYLRATLASVYAQTYENWELVIADDGSDEDTKAFLRTVEVEHRAKLIWLPHSGRLATVRNAALRVAEGAYVAFLDSDDLWLPRKLSVQLEILRARADCGWSYTAFSNVDADGKLLAEESRRRWVPYDGDIFEKVVTGEASIRTPSVLANRELVAQAGGFDEATGSATDYDLWTRLALRSRVAIVDESLLHVRHHEDNHSTDWEGALIGREHSLHKMLGIVEPRWRPLLEKERAANCIKRALTHVQLKNYPAAAAALWTGIPYAWRHPRLWKGFVKAVLRPYVPKRILAIYHRARQP